MCILQLSFWVNVLFSICFWSQLPVFRLKRKFHWDNFTSRQKEWMLLSWCSVQHVLLILMQFDFRLWLQLSFKGWTFIHPRVVCICLCLLLCHSLCQFLSVYRHRRRLVINIGGQKFGSEILGEQRFRENIFSDIIKKIWKNPLLFSKISEDLFLVIDNFTPFSLYFSFFVYVSAFFHVFTC